MLLPRAVKKKILIKDLMILFALLTYSYIFIKCRGVFKLNCPKADNRRLKNTVIFFLKVPCYKEHRIDQKIQIFMKADRQQNTGFNVQRFTNNLVWSKSCILRNLPPLTKI